MRKYTKKIVAFLLATAMVLTGLPMNATEVKAAEAETIYYRFDRPTTGAVQIGGDGTSIGLDETSANTTYYMSTSLAGDGWVLNTDKTTVPKQAADETLYENAGTSSSTKKSGANLQKWASGNRIAYWFNYGNTLAYDIEVPEAGNYVVEVYYLDHKNHKAADVKFNDVLLGTVPANATGADTSEVFATVVALNQGTNLVSFTTQGTSYYGSTLKYMTLSKIGYGEASINLEDGAAFYVGDSLALSTTATLNDGTAIESGLSVVYSSNNEAVAKITDGTLSIVGRGAATITAEVSYNGVLEETLTRNITADVEGAFALDFTETDTSTIHEVVTDATRYYFTTTTKSRDDAAVKWVLNADLTNDDMEAYTGEDGNVKNGGIRTYVVDDACTYIQFFSSGRDVVFDVEIPAAGTYNLSVDVAGFGEKFGYMSFFIDGVYVGSIDCYTGNASVQNLLSYTFDEAGTHQVKLNTPSKSSGTNAYASVSRINFMPTDDAGARKITSLEAVVDVNAYDMADVTEGTLSFNATTTNNDVILVGDYTYASDNTEVIRVARTGAVTARAAGEANLSVSMAGVTASTPVTVNDTRPRYTITWLNDDGTELEVDAGLLEGEAISYDGETPTKAATAQYTYTFAGWTPEVAETVTGDATYTATYTFETNGYNITWIVNGEETTEVVASGATPVAPEVEGYEDAYYTYEFTGWSPEITEVTGDATYEATFAKVAKTYAEAVTARTDSYGEVAVSEDGKTVTLDVTGSVPYTKNPEGVWANWIGLDVTTPEGVDPANVTVKRNDGTTTTLAEALDTETTASFYVGAIPTTTVLVREYQIDWNSDGTYDLTFVYDLTNATLLTKTFNVTWVVNGVETTEAVTAGTMPAAPSVDGYADAQYTYTFAGWDKEIVAAEADATYTAQFDAVVNGYTVTWVNHDGATIATDTVEYGTVPTAPEAPSYKEYAFLGWDSEVVAVTGDATYTAVYDIDGIDEGYYYVDGILQSENAQLVKIGDNLYYVQHSGAIKKNGNQTISSIRTNGYVEAGTYYFNEEGIMRNPADDLSGTIGEDGYYYVNGEVRKNVGLVQIDGYYYYVLYSGKVKVSGNQAVSADKLNDYAVEAGTYYFYANGVMGTDEVKMSGSVVEGKYYVFGELTKNVGLVELANGDFIFVQYSGNVRQSGFQTIKEATCNGHTEYIGVQKFADGVMIK